MELSDGYYELESKKAFNECAIFHYPHKQKSIFQGLYLTVRYAATIAKKSGYQWLSDNSAVFQKKKQTTKKQANSLARMHPDSFDIIVRAYQRHYEEFKKSFPGEQINNDFRVFHNRLVLARKLFLLCRDYIPNSPLDDFQRDIRLLFRFAEQSVFSHLQKVTKPDILELFTKMTTISSGGDVDPANQDDETPDEDQPPDNSDDDPPDDSNDPSKDGGDEVPPPDEGGSGEDSNVIDDHVSDSGVSAASTGDDGSDESSDEDLHSLYGDAVGNTVTPETRKRKHKRKQKRGRKRNPGKNSGDQVTSDQRCFYSCLPSVYGGRCLLNSSSDPRRRSGRRSHLVTPPGTPPVDLPATSTDADWKALLDKYVRFLPFNVTPQSPTAHNESDSAVVPTLRSEHSFQLPGDRRLSSIRWNLRESMLMKFVLPPKTKGESGLLEHCNPFFYVVEGFLGHLILTVSRVDGCGQVSSAKFLLTKGDSVQILSGVSYEVHNLSGRYSADLVFMVPAIETKDNVKDNAEDDVSSILSGGNSGNVSGDDLGND